MQSNTDEIRHLLALEKIPGIGEVTVKQLLSYFGNAVNIFNASKGKLMQVPGIGAQAADALVKSKLPLQEADLQIARAEDAGDRILTYTHPDYPARLRRENDAPTVIFVAGNTNFNAERMVSIVGTRNATEYGLSITRELVQFLSGHGVTIISGLAYGIDYAAHVACIDYAVPTVAVMANGLDKVYPAKHKSLTKTITAKGGSLISELGYGTMAEAHYFAARNRIIAAMSDVVIIVEAAAKGGALITAELANGYNKEVMAVPGPINAPFSAGCNNLIYQNKAACLARFEDIIPHLNWDLAKPNIVEQSASMQLSMFSSELSPQELEVVTYLQTHPLAHIDEICRGTAIPINSMAGVLLNLEFAGLVRAIPGKKFTLTR